MTTEYAAPERFAISHVGMRELNVGRAPAALVKELIQNAWDEAPEATSCKVTVRAHKTEQATVLVVEDDGPGFENIEDAWTLMRHTNKRMDPNKRGRFNLGEKELISVAMEATIETVGHTVVFPRMGSRMGMENDRRRGTRIEAVMPWNEDEREELIDRLRRFRPTDCSLSVNGTKVRLRTPVASRSTILRTVLQDGPGEPMRDTKRRTTMEVLERADHERSWLYEMGIPIQPIDSPWDVDVLQKVPMPPQRDTVSEAYLTDIYAEILNETREILERDQFGEEWVKKAVGDDRSEPETVVRVVEGRYGERAALGSGDRDANMRATEAGYEVINPRSLSRTERKKFREDAGLQTTYALFGERAASTESRPAATDGERAFADWVIALGRRAGLTVTVEFSDDSKAAELVSCTAATWDPIVRFNVARPSEDFTAEPFGRPDQLTIIYHELGHALAHGGVGHGPSWGHAVATAAGLISAWPGT